MTEHVGRPMVADRQINTPSNQVSAMWRFLAWTMNYHAEHHFASSVPFHALGQLHERIKDHVYVEEQGYLHAHRTILDSMAALCTHAGAALCDGYFDGHVIECPLHRGGFGIRYGRALFAPVTRPLRTYPVKLEAGRVLVQVAT